MKSISAVVLALFLFVSLTNAQLEPVNATCNFIYADGVYSCFLDELVLTSVNQPVTITGEHFPGYNNSMVGRVVIAPRSSIPFIMTQIFTEFGNLNTLWWVDGGLVAIQQNAFENARNLRNLYIIDNLLLTEIPANAFSGAVNLVELTMRHNRIVRVHPQAFYGVSNLIVIRLDMNHIHHLAPNVFAQLPNLREVNLNDNAVEDLDGRIFASNPQMAFAFFVRNEIGAIGRSLLDNIGSLRVLNLNGNICVSHDFSIVTPEDLEAMRPILRQCFENFGDESDVRRFTLEVRGSLVLFDEDGNEIVSL